MVKRGPKTTALGRDIAERREALGWSQMELARRAGVSSVAMIESGERKSPHFSTIKKIAEALGCDPRDLGRPKNSGPLPPELAEFCKTPGGADVTQAELEELMRLDARGRRPTVQTYYWALQAIRSMLPEEDA